MRRLVAALLVSGCAADPCAGTDTCIDLEVSGDVGALDTLSLIFTGVVTRQADAALPPPAAPPPLAVGLVLPPVSGTLDVDVIGLLAGSVAGFGATEAQVVAHAHQRVSVRLSAGIAPDDGGSDDLASSDLTPSPDLSMPVDMSCPSGLIFCGGNCVSPNDVSHCGSCNNVCNVPNATTSCPGGNCLFTCLQDWGDCDNNPTNGCETLITVDQQNCGGCNMPCVINNGAGSCANGMCRLVSCNKCYAGCLDPNACDTNTCVEPANCGTCGKSCAANAAGTNCVNGKCGCASFAADCSPKLSDRCAANLCLCGTTGSACVANKTCFMGTCLLDSGQPCSVPTQCLSGICINFVCM
jgi:hypothetical protein